MLEIIWHYGEPPKDMEVRQVYAICFDKQGRTMLKIEDNGNKKVYGMIGGTPEKFDADRLATLKREYIEEVNTTLQDPIYLVGYAEIKGDHDLPNYAQLRMVAMIDKIGEKKPDPDNGKIYDRILTSPIKAIQLLNWGESAEKPIKKAMEIAKEKFGIEYIDAEDEYV